VTDIQADIDAVNNIAIVPKLLEVICRTTGMGFAAIARVTDDKWVACSVRDEIKFGLEPGGELSLETTICHEIRQSGKAVVIDHVAEDEHFARHHTPAMYGFQSYISMPIVRKDGTFFGTLCSIDPKPSILNKPEIIGMFMLFADLVSFHLQAVNSLVQTESELHAERQTVTRQGQSNHELTQVNNQLADTQQHLQDTITKLTESEAKLRQAIETGKMGTWSIDLVTMKLTMSDFIRELFGFSVHQVVPLEEIMALIDEDYRHMVETTLNNNIQSQMPSDMEYSITNPNTHEQKWVRATGRMFYNAEGIPIEYSGMLMDITERKLDDIRKNDFIGMVSHELKTPLTTLTAYMQLLHAQAIKGTDNFLTNALEKANTQIKKMSSMINGFLNVSRLDSGKIQLNKQPFYLDELLRTVIDDMVLSVIGYTINFESCLPTLINADSDKIGNVVTNLLSNAIKYSPKGKVVIVRCQIKSDSVEVSVKDEGMGIKPQDIDKLFDRFYRVDNKHTQYISGFGIGLYLSAEIVKRHGGRIWAESQSGVGSTFYFSLPLH
jgi:PAS domain S-box-containing protein